MLGAPWYGLCNHTVTIYNAYGPANAKQYKRTLIEGGAFFGPNRQWKDGKRGSTAQSGFLLVIPQGAGGQKFVQDFIGADGTYTLEKDTKVFAGVGPEVATAQEWAALIPASVPGLVVIGSVDVKKGLWDDAITHVEAGE